MRDVERLVDNAQEVSQQLNDGKRFMMDCPRCNSQAVYVSRSGNARIFFPASLLVSSIRCHNCSKRFLVRSRLLGGVAMAKATAATGKVA